MYCLFLCLKIMVFHRKEEFPIFVVPYSTAKMKSCGNYAKAFQLSQNTAKLTNVRKFMKYFH